MAFPKGLFTPNVVRVQNPRPTQRPFSSQAVRVSGMEGPRSMFRGPREPELPKPQKIGGAQ